MLAGGKLAALGGPAHHRMLRLAAWGYGLPGRAKPSLKLNGRAQSQYPYKRPGLRAPGSAIRPRIVVSMPRAQRNTRQHALQWPIALLPNRIRSASALTIATAQQLMGHCSGQYALRPTVPMYVPREHLHDGTLKPTAWAIVHDHLI